MRRSLTRILLFAGLAIVTALVAAAPSPVASEGEGEVVVRPRVLQVEMPDTALGLIGQGARAKIRCNRTCLVTVRLVVRGDIGSRLDVGPTIATAKALVGAGTSRWIRMQLDAGAAEALAELPGSDRPSVTVRARARAF